MSARRIPAVATLLIVALAFFLLAGAACVDGSEKHNPWSGWTTLRLKAKSVPLMRGHVEMRLSEGADGRRLETTTSARFIGVLIAKSDTTTLFDPATGFTKRYQSFSKKKGRRYLFDDKGYSVEKLRGSKDDTGRESWEVSSRFEYAYPATDDGTGVRRLFDYYGMLLHLRELELNAPGDEVTLHVATSRGPRAYRIVVSESRSSEHTFTDLRTREKTTLPSREFRLTISPADPEAEEGFLKMEGETEIWVEAETKTPLEIVGKVPKVPGKVKLVLTAMR